MLCYERSSVLFVFKRGLLNRVVLWNGVYNLESIFTMLNGTNWRDIIFKFFGYRGRARY